jgi:hypothetical protein
MAGEKPLESMRDKKQSATDITARMSEVSASALKSTCPKLAGRPQNIRLNIPSCPVSRPFSVKMCLTAARLSHGAKLKANELSTGSIGRDSASMVDHEHRIVGSKSVIHCRMGCGSCE